MEKQILILALCVAALRTVKCRCYDENQLEEKAQKMLRKYSPRPVDMPTSEDSSISCPVDLYEKLPHLDINDRSLSPWKYLTVTNPDYYPHTYTEAKCLCNGCILVLKNGTVTHSSDYNTVPLKRNWVFLKRVKDGCGEGKYRLEPERVKVAVGCVCVRPDTNQS